MAVVAALVGFLLALVVVKLGNRIQNRILRYGAMLCGICAGLFVAGLVAGSNENASSAGMFMLALAAIYTLIFERKKKERS